VYATSSDAVMLTDEQNRILWSNSAFRRAATEKTSGKMQVGLLMNKCSRSFLSLSVVLVSPYTLERKASILLP
jgi:hypothetical protein